ncbi:MAG: hypothetical protein U0638_04720 [Phycisphaerales bacterium]
MKSMILGVVGLAALAGTASASDIDVTATFVDSYDMGVATTVNTNRDVGQFYANRTNFSGFAAINGGAGVDPANGANTITKLLADDVNFHPFFIGQNVSKMYFTVANLNTTAVSARARLRFYADNAGAPGTALTGFSFNPISFTANTVSSFFFAPNISFSTNHIWIGMTFDNNGGATGATLAQLNNLGQGLYNPPVVGTSADKAFLTSSQGSWLSNNPTGSVFNYGGNPVANIGYELDVPAPSAAALFGLVGFAASRRRR